MLAFLTTTNPSTLTRTVAGPVALLFSLLLPVKMAAATGSVVFNGYQTALPFSALNGPAGVAVDHLGNVYVADGTGKQVVRLNVSSQTTSTLGSGWSNPAGVAVDTSGNVFVADAGNNQVVEIPASGSSTTVGSGLNAPHGVAVDASGNIYIADTGNNRVIMYSAAGGTLTSIGTGLSAPSAVAVDAASNVFIADTGNHRVVKVASGVQGTVGSGWMTPTGIAVDTAANVYVADTGLNAVEKVPSGSSSSTAIGTGLNAAKGVAVDLYGNVFIADTGNLRVLEIQINSINAGSVAVGQHSATFALTFTFTSATTLGSVGILTQGSSNLDFQDGGSSTCTPKSYAVSATCTLNVVFKPLAPGRRSGAAVLYDGSTPNNKPFVTVYLSGLGTGAALAITPPVQTSLTITNAPVTPTPEGIAVDVAGNIYIADAANAQVVRIAAGTGTQTTVGSGLKTPYGVALDGGGNLYIADYGRSTITRVPNENGVLNTADQTQIGSGLSVVRAITTDAFGNVYAVDYNNFRIVEIPSSGAAQIYFGTGVVNKVRGVAVDSSGNVIVGDASDSQVLLFPPGGGSAATILLPPDSSVLGATVTAPFGLAVDASGSVYVADSSNNRILLLPKQNGTLNVAAAVAYGTGLSLPSDVKLDGTGNLYIADTDNARGVLLNNGAATLSFGSRSIGLATAAQTESIFNIGNTALTFSSPAYTVTGNAGDFIVQSPSSGGCAFTSALGTGLGCSLSFTFKAVAAGARSASFAFTQAPVSPAAPQFALNGTGTASTSAITLSVPATTVNYGQGTTVTAVVSGSGAGTNTPTGTVTFTINGTALAPITLGANDTIVLPITNLIPGLNTISAVYSGDANFPIASSSTLIVGMKPQDFRGLYTFSNINSADATNPAFAGTNLIFYWTDIQPTKNGTPNWALVTAAAQPWINAGKKVILRFSTAGQVGFGGSAGNATPAWVYQDGARSVTESDGSVIPVYWDAAYQADYANFVQLLAQQYDGAPWVAFVEAGIGMGGETLPDTESNPNRNTLWAAVGYTDPIYLNCVETLLNINRQNFLKTPVVPMLDSTFLGFGGVAGVDYYGTLSSWMETLPLPFWLQYNGLTNTSGLPSVFSQAPVRAVEQRNSTVNSGDPIEGDVQQGFVVNAQYQLIYTSDVDNAAYQSTFQAAAALANSGTSVTTTSVVASASTVQEGQSVTLTATVTSVLAGLTGLVNFYDGSTVLGSATLNGSGVATFMTSSLGVGAHSITAANTGDGVYLASTSTAVPVQVQTATTLTPSVSPTTSTFGQNVTLKATITPQTGTAPVTGTVVFTVDNVAQPAATVSSGVATLVLASPAVGSHSFTAAYSGDADNLSSSSTTPLTFTVTAPPDFTITPTSTVLTVTAGQSVTDTLTITPTNGFNQPVSFTCSGLPALSMCTFAPASVTPNGAAASSVLTISTTAAIAANTHERFFYALLLPGLVFCFAFRKRRRTVGRLLACVSCAVLFNILGCGSSNKSAGPSQPGTPAGSSAIVITATSTGTVSVTHQVTITLNVQ